MPHNPLFNYVESFCKSSSGKWHAKKHLGKGNSASVYLIVGEGCERALKIYEPRFFVGENAIIERRRIEDQLSLKGHGHPNLIEIFDAGPVEDTYYLLMEYLPWAPLNTVLGSVSPNDVKNIISQVAAAAEYLETKCFVHRDIKPANILISPEHTHVKLLDLGVMRSISPDEADGTDNGLKRPFVATAQYSSPEYLFRLREPTPDLWRGLTFYQLGAVLHDLIMGRPLFQDEVDTQNKFNVAMAVNSKTPFVSNDEVDPQLVALARNCLRKDGKQRLDRVGWDLFRATENESIDDARQRLKLGAARLESDTAISDPRVDEERRKLELDQLVENVEGLARSVLLNAGFPPAGYERFPPNSGNDNHKLSITFKPIHARQENTELAFLLTVVLEGAEKNALDIFLDCRLIKSGGTIVPSKLERSIWTTTVAQLDKDVPAFSSRLEAHLIELYDRAVQRVNTFEDDETSDCCVIE